MTVRRSRNEVAQQAADTARKVDQVLRVTSRAASAAAAVSRSSLHGQKVRPGVGGGLSAQGPRQRRDSAQNIISAAESAALALPGVPLRRLSPSEHTVYQVARYNGIRARHAYLLAIGALDSLGARSIPFELHSKRWQALWFVAAINTARQKLQAHDKKSTRLS